MKNSLTSSLVISFGASCAIVNCGAVNCIFHRRKRREIVTELWRRGVVVNALVAINEVTLRRARLVLGYVSVCGHNIT